MARTISATRAPLNDSLKNITPATAMMAAATGSACHSGRHELSTVLQAMNVPESIGLGAVRFSLGRWTTTEELDHVLGLFRSRVMPRKV